MFDFYNLKNLFKNYVETAESHWDEFWEKKKKAENIDNWEKKAYEQYQLMMKGGKHLRACLVLMGWRLAGKDAFDPNIMKASGSIEILHNAFLIHDDIVDKSLLRRNLKTVHEKYKDDVIDSFNLALEDAKDFGVSVALNIGDLGQALAQEILMDASFPPSAIVKGINLFNKHLQHTVLGQMYDLDILPLNELTEDYVEKIHTFKTAYYTFVFPLLLGYFLAEGNPDNTSLIEKYGILTGIVYQMQDDYLGVFGKEAEIGKSNESDIVEGKKTLYVVKAYENGSLEDKKALERILGNKLASNDDIELVRNIINKTGALAYSDEKINRFTKEAISVLHEIKSEDKKVISILEDVTKYVSERES